MLDRTKSVVNLVRVKPLVTFRARRALHLKGISMLGAGAPISLLTQFGLRRESLY